MKYASVRHGRGVRHGRSVGTVAGAVVGAVVAAVAWGSVVPVAVAATPDVGVTGTVVRGVAPVEGADVSVSVWPSDRVLAALPDGAPVTLISLGTTRTDSRGAYAVSSALADVPADYREADGSLSVEVDVTSAAGATQWNSTVGGSAPLSRADSFDLAGSVREDGVQTALAVTAPASGATSAAAGAAPDNGGPTCHWAATSTYKQATEFYGQADGAPGVWAHLTQTATSTHTLGIAVEGSNGAWSGSGSSSVSVTSGTSSSTSSTNYSMRWYNTINYRGYNWICTSGSVKHTYRAVSTYGRNSEWHQVTHPYYGYCINQRSGTNQIRHLETSYTNSGGVSLGFVSVNAELTWGSDVTEEIKFLTASQYCGTAAQGPEQSARVEGHPNQATPPCTGNKCQGAAVRP